MLEEEKQLLEERVKELTEQLEKPQQKAGMERLVCQLMNTCSISEQTVCTHTCTCM